MNRLMLIFIGLAVIASAIPASAAENNNRSIIVVQGEGKVNAVPDTAVIVLGVETRNASASVAARENAEMMNLTVQALLDAGISAENIQTSRYSLTTLTEDNDRPLLSPAGNRTPRPVEFIAVNQVKARMNATEGVGRVLDAAIEAGSNSIQSVTFELEDSKPSTDAALREAVSDAQRKAEVLSSASGVSLGRIMEISGGYSYATDSGAMFALAEASPTPIQPGQLEITSSISITYEISQ